MLLRLFGLEMPHAAESLEIWYSCLGRRLRAASAQQVAEMTKFVGWAVAGCGEANVISEHSSNTTGLYTTGVQQHYVFRATHELQSEHM